MLIYVCTSMPLWYTPVCFLPQYFKIFKANRSSSGPPLRADAHSSLQSQGGTKVQPQNWLGIERAFFSKVDYALLCFTVLLGNGLLVSHDVFIYLYFCSSGQCYFWGHNIFFQNYGGDCLWQALPHGSSTHKNTKGIKKIQKVGNDTSWIRNLKAATHTPWTWDPIGQYPQQHHPPQD